MQRSTVKGAEMPQRNSREPSSAKLCRPLGCLHPLPMVAIVSLYQNDFTGAEG